MSAIELIQNFGWAIVPLGLIIIGVIIWVLRNTSDEET